jgi:hypothetical protein
MDAELRQQPTADKGTYNPDNQITNDPNPGPTNDLTC